MHLRYCGLRPSNLSPDSWFVAAASYLFLAWCLFFAVDVLNIPELRDGAVWVITGEPLIFLWLFGERGPTEMLQWIYLGTGIILCQRLVRHHWELDERQLAGIFALGFAALLLMFTEDTLNIRHRLALYVIVPLFDADPKGMVRTATEMTFYALLGGLMVAFFVLTIGRFRQIPRASAYLIAGYAFYAVASVSSASRYIGQWYRRVGAWIVDMAFPHLDGIYAAAYPAYLHPVGYWIMDFLVEETLELAGAACLAVALLHLARDASRTQCLHGRPMAASEPAAASGPRLTE